MPILSSEQAIVAAKTATYVGGGPELQPCRTGSHDIGWNHGPWRYLDSYFGGTDFSGQEVMWHDETPVWAMSYYGYVIQPDLIDASRAGKVIKTALSALYLEHRRFLGGFQFAHEFGTYIDENQGDFDRFSGRERIEIGGVEVYALIYHGGRILP
jgi:hypothetical protein